MKTTLVSICIPTYNGSSYIAEAIESAISQTYQNIELVISDDSSTDDTLSIVEYYKKKTSIPINIHHHEPKGIGANWNNCIIKANGTYIKFLFQDDVLMPNCIEEQLKVLNSNSELKLVASQRVFILDENFKSQETYDWIDRFGNLQEGLELKSYDNYVIIDSKVFKSPLFLKSPFNKIGEPSTYLFKKELVKEVGYFREDLNQVLDYEFCYRVLKKNVIGILNEELCKFRLHALQATQANTAIFKAEQKTYIDLIFVNYFWLLNFKAKLKILRKKYKLIDSILKLKTRMSNNAK